MALTAQRGSNASISQHVWDPSATGVERRRRLLQIILGVIWLLDAGLQYKPFMFSTSFVNTFIKGSATGNPDLVKQPILSAAHLIIHHPAIWNTGFATIQLVLAIGILWRPTVKLALGASIVWSLLVWWFGEGMGGLFSGATPVMGYPGAVLLYALIALMVWPTDRSSTSVATSGPLGETLPKVLWLILWGSFVRFLLLSANRSPQGLNSALAGMAPGEPGWEKSIDNNLASALAHHGTEVSIVLAVLCAFVALAVFWPQWIRVGLMVSVVAAFAFWVAQDFGGLFTSQGTDPNSGPLLVLLAATFWPLLPARRSREGVGRQPAPRVAA